MCENSLRLVVRGMRHGDARGSSFGHEARKECVPELASGFLDIPFLPGGGCRHVFARQNEFEPSRAGEILDETGVAMGFRTPKSVVKMRHKQCHAERLAKRLQQTKKCGRIRAARDGYSDSVAGQQHSRLADAL
jgi:hypothetical protein